MPRKQDKSIVNEKNRATAELAQMVIGDRSYIEAAQDMGLKNPSTLSYIARGKVKPTPGLIQIMTKEESKPQGGVTYEEFMQAAGYLEKTTNAQLEQLFSSLPNDYYSADKPVASTSVSPEQLEDMKKEKYMPFSSISYRQKDDNRKEIMKQRMTLEEACNKTLFYEAFNHDVKVLNRIQGIKKYTSPDMIFDMNKVGCSILRWNLFYTLVNPEMTKNGGLSLVNISLLFYHIFRYGITGPSTKTSIVVNSARTYSMLQRYKDNFPYRGELSIILVDENADKVLKEEYLSHYIEDDISQEFIIADEQF